MGSKSSNTVTIGESRGVVMSWDLNRAIPLQLENPEEWSCHGI